MGTTEGMHQGSNLIESAKLTWEETSWKWHLPAWPSMLVTCHASWPVWSIYHHIFEPTPVFPGPTHTPAELWLDWHLVEAWGLGESPILPPSGSPLLDRAVGLPIELTTKLGQRGGVPLLSFAIEPLRYGETLSTLSLSLLEARPPWCHRRGGIWLDIAGPVGIGWRNFPWRVCSHLDRGDGKTLKEYRECWLISSPQPHLALVICFDVGQRVALEPSIMDWSWQQKAVTMPRSPSPYTICNQYCHWDSFPTYFFNHCWWWIPLQPTPTLQGRLCGQNVSPKLSWIGEHPGVGVLELTSTPSLGIVQDGGILDYIIITLSLL